MEFKDWSIVFAAILGPILAVQAQKAVERIREQRHRKLWVFQTLMATRAARTAVEHVQALNMINLAFYGSNVFGMRRRKKQEQTVLDAWKEYHDQLNTPTTPENTNLWNDKIEELFIKLLYAISQDLGFSFDRVELKKGAYSPIAHGNLLSEQAAMRKMSIELLEGKRPLKMDITSLPIPPAQNPPPQVPQKT